MALFHDIPEVNCLINSMFDALEIGMFNELTNEIECIILIIDKGEGY